MYCQFKVRYAFVVETLLFINLLLLNRSSVSSWLGSARKRMLPHHWYTNRSSQRRSKKMPTVRSRSGQSHIRHRKSVHLWSSSQAEHSYTVWSVARTPPESRRQVLLGGWHSAGRLHSMGCYWTKLSVWEMWSHDRLWSQRRKVEWYKMHVSYRVPPQHGSCYSLSENIAFTKYSWKLEMYALYMFFIV